MKSIESAELKRANAKTLNASASLSRSPVRSTRLLVSVRSADEAVLAIQGGADILDVKEPSLGSLGMASVGVISSITKLNEIVTGTVPLSVALGEVAEWSGAIPKPSLPAGITFAKLGLSCCVQNPHWRDDWNQVRIEFERLSQSRLQWVAVAYADSEAAGSPSIEQVLQAATETECAGLLIDTFTKDGLTLLDFMAGSKLTAIANGCHSAGLFFALAGKLGIYSLPALASVSADVFAIRSAACRGTDRTSEVDAHRVTEFRDAMRRLPR